MRASNSNDRSRQSTAASEGAPAMHRRVRITQLQHSGSATEAWLQSAGGWVGEAARCDLSHDLRLHLLVLRQPAATAHDEVLVQPEARPLLDQSAVRLRHCGLQLRHKDCCQPDAPLPVPLLDVQHRLARLGQGAFHGCCKDASCTSTATPSAVHQYPLSKTLTT